MEAWNPTWRFSTEIPTRHRTTLSGSPLRSKARMLSMQIIQSSIFDGCCHLSGPYETLPIPSASSSKFKSTILFFFSYVFILSKWAYSCSRPDAVVSSKSNRLDFRWALNKARANIDTRASSPVIYEAVLDALKPRTLLQRYPIPTFNREHCIEHSVSERYVDVHFP